MKTVLMKQKSDVEFTPDKNVSLHIQLLSDEKVKSAVESTIPTVRFTDNLSP